MTHVIDEHCKHRRSKVVDSRTNNEGRMRTRVCKDCGERFGSFEIYLDGDFRQRRAIDQLKEAINISNEQQAEAIDNLIRAALAVKEIYSD